MDLTRISAVEFSVFCFASKKRVWHGGWRVEFSVFFLSSLEESVADGAWSSRFSA
jgi:hypothetical protein